MKLQPLRTACLLTLLTLTPTPALSGQNGDPPDDRYEPSAEYPYGRPNPDAHPELEQFAFIVGRFECTDRRRQSQDEWTEEPKIWLGRYYLNGHAIRDDTWRATGSTSNIRVYDPEAQEWVITYFTSGGAAVPPMWRGGKEGGELSFRQPSTSPQGVEGTSRLTFSDIQEDSFEWEGAFVVGEGSPEEFVYTFWTSSCRRAEPS